LQVSIFPRNGKTTIRIFESLSEPVAGIYGGFLGGLGGGGGALLIALMKKFGPIEGVFARGDNPNVQLGLLLWVTALVPISYLAARFSANSFSVARQEALKAMLRELSEKARESIDYKP
jgi:hypothetical protein